MSACQLLYPHAHHDDLRSIGSAGLDLVEQAPEPSRELPVTEQAVVLRADQPASWVATIAAPAEEDGFLICYGRQSYGKKRLKRRGIRPQGQAPGGGCTPLGRLRPEFAPIASPLSTANVALSIMSRNTCLMGRRCSGLNSGE